MSDNKTVARPYAEAIFGIAREQGMLDELSTSLEAARDILANRQLVDFLAAPSMTREQRLEFLQGLFSRVVGEDSVFAGGSRQGTNFLKLLLENDRIAVLPDIAERFDALRAELENTVDVVVTSATALSDAQVSEFSKVLRTRLGREVNIETKIDKDLIGGAVITAGDVVIDGSTRARLEGLAHALTR